MTTAPPSAPSGAGMDRRIVKPKWRNHRLLWVVGAVALIVVAALVIPQIPPPGSLTVKASDLEIGTAVRAPFQDYLPVRGEVAPLHTVFVTAVSGGYVRPWWSCNSPWPSPS